MISKFYKTLLCLNFLFLFSFSFGMQQGVQDNNLVKIEKEVRFAKSLEIDTQNITDILNYVGLDKDVNELEKTLVIFDIDGVVMIPKQLLGNDPWAYYEGDKFIAKYNNGTVKGASKEVFIKGMAEFKQVWSFVQNNVEVKLVDEKFTDVLEKLFKNCIKIMGFTARGTDLVDRTKYQMDSINVDFSKNAYCLENIKTKDYINKNGVLFVDLGVSKGEILKRFFAHIGKKPGKIVFIDDQPKNIKTIKEMCEQENISFVGIRYGGADEISKLDDTKKKICDIQLERLRETGKVLSDKEAGLFEI
ncbi:MAG: hypothetical protein UR12_C0008G0001 [candidate division TM6 bacterium GW2011_GWF2_30_66]|nr:MAG: hypothetical protein UR12_C0008G0001 [candidate division TM6 bacterium GW2011_GWF2_30_66]